jgi:hypothetical protein
MALNASATPLPTKWEKLLPILALGTEGKKYSFDFESLPLSTPKEVVAVLVAYLSLLAFLKVRYSQDPCLSRGLELDRAIMCSEARIVPQMPHGHF